MKTTVGLGLGLFLGPACIPEELPPAIKADKLVVEGARAIGDDEPEEAMRALEALEAMGVEPPARFADVLGTFLAEHGEGADGWRKAQVRLTLFAVDEGSNSGKPRGPSSASASLRSPPLPPQAPSLGPPP